MNNQKISGLLGLAFGARKITVGETALKDIQSKTARLVIISDQASDNTKKRYINKADYYQIPYALLDDELLNNSLGKNNIKTIAINDQGFAKKLNELLKG